MVQYFSDKPDLRHRALQVYLILIGAAHSRRILTYKIVADLLGYGGAGVLDRQLGHLMFWCEDNKLPPLTQLVVNSETGDPGPGLRKPVSKSHNELREEVFNFNWYNIIPPSLEELAESYKDGMDEIKRGDL